MPFPFSYLADEKEGFLHEDYDDDCSSNGSGFGTGGRSSKEREKRKYLCLFQTRWIIWRFISGVMGIFFFAAAYVQHNDPDPYLWMPAYMIPCVISWAVALGMTVKKSYKRINSRESSPPGALSSRAEGTTAAGPLPSPSSVNGHSKLRHLHSSSKKPIQEMKTQAEVDTDSRSVLIARYGSTNRKFNWIITIHMIYCFALGLWTLTVYTYGTHQVNSGLEAVNMFGHKLQMDSSTEEAKELMGLCLIIAWLSLLRHNNYVLLGKLGICVGAGLTILPFVAWILVELYDQDSKCH